MGWARLFSRARGRELGKRRPRGRREEEETTEEEPVLVQLIEQLQQRLVEQQQRLIEQLQQQPLATERLTRNKMKFLKRLDGYPPPQPPPPQPPPP